MPAADRGHGRTQTLLQISKLLDCRDHISPFTLVVDSLEQPAAPLLQEFVRRSKSTKTKSVFISFDSLKAPEGTDTFIRAYDIPLDALAQEIQAHTSDPASNYLLIISNLHSLLINPAVNLPSLILPLVSPRATLVTVLHADQPLSSATSSPQSPYSPPVLTSLRFLATTVLRTHSLSHKLAERRAHQRSVAAPAFGIHEDMEGTIKGLSSAKPSGLVVEMEHRRKSGRAIHALFVLEQMRGHGSQARRDNVVLLEDHPAWIALGAQQGGEANVKDEMDVSFSLGLTEKQRQDREGVVLPYFDAQREQSGPGEGGRILYDMGVEDDFDEEEDEI